MNIIISTNKFADKNFYCEFILKTQLETMKNCSCYEKLDIKNIKGNEAILFSFTKSYGENLAKIAIVEDVEENQDSYKITFKEIEDSSLTCSQISKKIYRFQCINDLRDKKFFQFFLSESDFNDILYPERKEAKYKNLLQRLQDFEDENQWLDMVKEFGDLEEFDNNFPEYSNDAMFLQKNIVYPLSHIVKPGNRFKIQRNYNSLFLSFSNRVISLYPNNINFLSVRAYYHYNRYINKETTSDDEFFSALEYFNKILKIDKNHLTTLYRKGKIYQKYADNKLFDKNINRLEFYAKALDCYSNFKGAYLTTNEEKQKHNKKEYKKVLFNEVKVNMEYNINYTYRFFERYVIGEEDLNFVTQEKEILLEDSLNQLLLIMKLCSFDLSSSYRQISKEQDIEIIPLMYRISLCYQYKGLVLLMKKKKEESKNFFLEANKYIKKCFEYVNDMKNDGVNFNKPMYLHKEQAINLYFLGDKEKSIQKFEKGQSDSWLRVAQIAIYDKDKELALKFLDKIDVNDTKKEINKANALKEWIEKCWKD